MSKSKEAGQGTPEKNRNNGNGNGKQQVVPNFRGKKRKHYDALMELRDELAEQIRGLSSSRDYHREAGEDLADIGSENFSRDVALSLMSEEGEKIVLIHDAVQRLIEGTYGKCIDCGGDIGEGRLEALPYAKLCIDCKSAREANNGLPPVEDQQTAKELVE
ncbi:MAG: TraR/DksA family transcriptional regulator [Lentisphaeria bacterium]